MIAPDRLTSVSTYSTSNAPLRQQSNSNKTVNLFLKEAVHILIQANRSVSDTRNQTDTQKAEDDADATASEYTDAVVTWKLNLSPTLMTLDTNIQTIAGLEQVLEQLFANVEPQPRNLVKIPSATREDGNVSSERYQMTGLIYALGEALRLSHVLVIPQADMFQQFNTIQLMKQCVQVFIMCDGAFFMNVPQLLSTTDRVLSSPTLFHPDSDHPLDTLLLLSICCMMIRHVMVHRRGHTSIAAGLAHAYYSQARARLQEVFDIPHISVLQSTFILSLFPHGHVDLFSTSRQSSTLLTGATRLAMAMNLHRLDDSSHRPKRQQQRPQDNAKEVTEEMERRRRLAWMILCADHFSFANATGQTGYIDVNEWHVDFPQPLPSEALAHRVELFSHYCRTVMIRKMQLFRSAYMVVSQSNKALEAAMDEQLFERYTSTPAHLRLYLDLEREEHLTRQWTKADLEPLLLECFHSTTWITALIPFLPRRYLETFEQGILSREASIKDIYRFTKQQALANNCSISPLPPATSFAPGGKKLTHLQQQQNDDREEQDNDPRLELHTVVRCLITANRLNYILEVLHIVDPVHCHYRPTHAALMLVYMYDIIQTNCQHTSVATVCRLNLIRTLRLVQQARRMDPDLTLMYLERTIHSCVNLTDEHSTTLERTTAALLSTLRQQQQPLHYKDVPSTMTPSDSLDTTINIKTESM